MTDEVKPLLKRFGDKLRLPHFCSFEVQDEVFETVCYNCFLDLFEVCACFPVFLVQLVDCAIPQHARRNQAITMH